MHTNRRISLSNPWRLHLTGYYDELVAHEFSVSKLDLFVPMRNTSLKLIATTQIARKKSI